MATNGQSRRHCLWTRIQRPTIVATLAVSASGCCPVPVQPVNQPLPDGAGPAPNTRAPEASADDIITGVGKAYSECETYRDNGLVSLAMSSGNKRETYAGAFSTWFVRGVGFRLVFRHMGLYHQKDSIEVRSYRGNNHTSVGGEWRRHDSLKEAIVSTTGVTWGTSKLITELLMPASGSPKWPTMSSMIRMTDVDRHDGQWHQLVGNEGQGLRQIISVSESSHAVGEWHKIRDLSHAPLDPSGMMSRMGLTPVAWKQQEISVTFHPELNGPVSEDDIRQGGP